MADSMVTTASELDRCAELETVAVKQGCIRPTPSSRSTSADESSLAIRTGRARPRDHSHSRTLSGILKLNSASCPSRDIRPLPSTTSADAPRAYNYSG